MNDPAKTSTVLIRDYAQMQRDLEETRKQISKERTKNKTLRRDRRRWKARAWKAEAKLKELRDG